MEPLRWTADDCVYVPQLDTDHQKIFGDAENLRHAVVVGSPSSQLRVYIWRLCQSFSAHLASEEHLLRRSRYPGLQWHQSQHETGRKKIALLTQAVHNNDELGVREGLQDLARWLTDHVRLAGNAR